MTGTKQLTDAQQGTGESARADRQIAAAGLRQPAAESIRGSSSDVDKGRIPFLARRRRTNGVWARLTRGATNRPVAALVTVAALLAALAVPALDLHSGSTDLRSIAQDTPVVVAQQAIERAFPGAPDDAADEAESPIKAGLSPMIHRTLV